MVMTLTSTDKSGPFPYVPSESPAFHTPDADAQPSQV